MSSAPVQLLAYEFGPEAVFQGQLAGALQRLESGGALRILDVVFVQRDLDSGELSALDLPGDGAGGVTGDLLDFRLSVRSRPDATKRALAGARGPELLALGERLAPGASLAAVFVEHRWAEVLADAVQRVGGKPVFDAIVEDADLARHLPG
jgi:hypothetical protein